MVFFVTMTTQCIHYTQKREAMLIYTSSLVSVLERIPEGKEGLN